MKQTLRGGVVLLALVFAGAHAVGCAPRESEPLTASSADRPSYARKYPERLQSTVSDIDAQVKSLVDLSGEFEKYPDELKDPDWDLVIRVVEQADAEGQSAHYAERIQENGVVSAFYNDEKEEIHKRVGGAAQYQAKEKGCDADVYSASVHALDKSIEKQLEERTHEDSDAHQLIEQNQTTLGKANVEALKRQADKIAMASYVGHVGVARRQRELDQMLEDASTVESTLDERIEELSKPPPPEVKRSALEQKAIDDELTALKTAKQSLQADVTAAQESQKGAEERAERAEKLYVESLEQLNSLLEKKREEAKGES
jgi:hypothetical protein